MQRILFFLIILVACQPVPKTTEKPYLFRVENEEVNPDEFLYAYNKNSTLSKDSVELEEDVREYLDLYINFKLKVNEARKLGLDSSASYKNELEGYRKQLAEPYLTESSVTEQLLQEAYDRLKEEIRASHILISVKPGASPEDTLGSYNFINDIRDKALQGEDFGQLAMQYSMDPSAKSNRGDLGYFSALQMVYPFEEAAYSTQPGDISPIIRTRFGYHIIKVSDRRYSRGQVRVSHIMIRATDLLSKEDSATAKGKIDEIHRIVLKGELTWSEACRQFSEDINSRNTGGVLPWLGSGAVPPSFENQAFALDTIGEISGPVKTPFGWHIIKLEGKRGLDSFEDMRSSLENRIKRDVRSEQSEKAFFKRIKAENEFRENSRGWEVAVDQTNNELLTGKWTPSDSVYTDSLFTIMEEVYTVDDFLTYIKKNQRPSQGLSLEELVKKYYDDYVNLELKSYEEEHLSDKYFEYRMLYQEYAEGIMLFQLMDKKVWSKAVRDTAGLRSYYESNKYDYMSEETINGTLYNLASDSLRLILQDLMDRNDSLLQTIPELKSFFNEKSLVKSKKGDKSYFNEKSPLNLLVTEGPLQLNHPVIEKISEKTPGIYNLDIDGRFYLLEIESVGDPQPRPMESIKGLLISDYQEYLEEEWIRELKATYPVEVNDKVLNDIIQQLENQ